MTWVRLDDQFPEHEKVMSVGIPARWLHVTALCYCARNLTDGLLTAQQVKVVCVVAEVPRAKQQIAQLVDAGLWIKAEDSGYEINDYLEYNPPAEQVLKERDKAKDRMRKLRGSRERSGERSGEQTANVREKFGDPLPHPQPPSSKDDAPTRDAGTLEGTVSHELLAIRLTAAVGGGQQARDKIGRTLRGYSISEHDIVETIRAATGPGVKEPLAVALSELTKRRKKVAA